MDWTGNYSAAFYFSGLCLLSSAAFVVLVDCFVQKREANQMEVDKETNRDVSNKGNMK